MGPGNQGQGVARPCGEEARVRRTDAILEAVKTILEARRAEIDAAEDLRALTLEVKLRPRSATVRAVIAQSEHETAFVKTHAEK